MRQINTGLLLKKQNSGRFLMEFSSSPSYRLQQLCVYSCRSLAVYCDAIVSCYKKGGRAMDRLYKMVQGYFKRFPDGVEPFQMVTRLLEECGEVASEVNHFESSGIKRLKHGEPSKEALAGEIKQAMVALAQIAVYYSVQDELDKSINESLQRMKAESLID
jgi:NTP pyrophosphatase (non-canonical NTP hydrolase)